MKPINISYKFQPLFKLLTGEYPKVDTVIITGGRYSLKSYTVSIFANTSMFWYGWDILYTRYTDSAIVDSIKPEVVDKLELLGIKDHVRDQADRVTYNNHRIAFKGIKPGSKLQTANLKSLSGFNVFVNDEAEELPSYKVYEKVYLSVRDTDKRNLSILILNPTSKDHWIFQEFYDKKGLTGGENCVKDNVMYIHTSYLDATPSLMPANILAYYQRLKEDNPKEYENIVMGGWIEEPEGILLPKSKLRFEDLSKIDPASIIYRFSIADPANTGGDKFSNPFLWVAEINGRIVCYVKDVIHTTDGIEAACERIPIKVLDNGMEAYFIEDNGVGLAAALLIKRNLPANVKYAPFHSSIQKETRILSHFEFIQKFFVFDKDYLNNPEYQKFISDLTSYSREGDNKHRMDAIDILCGAAYIIKLKYHKVIYGK